MRFPDPSEFVKFYNVLLLTGPVALGIGGTLLWLAWRQRGERRDERAKWTRLVVFGCGALLIGAFHFVGAYKSVLNAIRYDLSPEELVEIRVVRLNARGDPISRAVTFSDRKILAEGFRLLEGAKAWHRNHEYALESYRIRLKFAGQESYSNLYLTILRDTNRNKGVDVVIPHIGPESGGTLNHAGEYSSAKFHQWFSRHVEPHL